MSTLGNVIWFVFGGWLAGLSWLIVAVLCHLSVVGIPFGIACWRIAQFAFFPFGKELIDARILGEKPSAVTFLGRVLWIVLAGFWIMLAEGVAAVMTLACCIVVIPIFLGAPLFAVGHAKLAMAALDPLGKRVVSSDFAKVARERHYQALMDKKLSRPHSR